MRRRAFLRGSANGHTVVDLLVSMGIGLSVMAAALSSTTVGRTTVLYDMVRTRLHEDLRGAMEVVSMNVREAGENFTGTFPAILVIDGASGAPDELIVRRNLLDEVIKVCAPVGGGSGADVYLTAGSTGGCVYSGQTTNYNAWRDYRTSQSPQTARAYLFNTGTRLGEWFTYISEADTGTDYHITASDSLWANSYDTVASAAYLMEEWHFFVVGDELRAVIDGDPSQLMRIATRISDFQVVVNLNDGTAVTNFDETDSWTNIDTISITTKTADTFKNKPIEVELSADFFPRNILSN